MGIRAGVAEAGGELRYAGELARLVGGLGGGGPGGGGGGYRWRPAALGLSP
jgi:hypothetical protein